MTGANLYHNIMGLYCDWASWARRRWARRRALGVGHAGARRAGRTRGARAGLLGRRWGARAATRPCRLRHGWAKGHDTATVSAWAPVHAWVCSARPCSS